MTSLHQRGPHPKPQKKAKDPRSPMKRKKRMRVRSKKMRAKYEGTADTEGRRAFRERILKERPQCEARKRLRLFVGPNTMVALVRCTRKSEDVHEILARSAGGAIDDEDNVVAVCRSCHRWIGENPKLANALGLRRSRYQR